MHWNLSWAADNRWTEHKNSPPFNGTRTFITALARAVQWNVSWAGLIHSTHILLLLLSHFNIILAISSWQRSPSIMILDRNVLPISEVCYLKPYKEEGFRIKRNYSRNFSKRINRWVVTQLKYSRSFDLSSHLEDFRRKLGFICTCVP